MRITLFVAVLVVASAYCFVQYYGIIGFFSWSMFAFPLLLLLLAVTSFIYALIRTVWPKTRTRWAAAPVFLLPVACVAVVPIGGRLHRPGVEARFRAHNQQLVAACEAFLKEVPENKYSWRPEFEIWPSLIGPTRRHAIHLDGVVYISFKGSPENDAGVAYNPEHKAITGHVDLLFGPRYWFPHGRRIHDKGPR